MKIFIQLLALCIFISCNNESNKTEQSSSEKTYFDLAKAVQNDISTNSKNKCGEEKTVLINVINETKKSDTVDWEKELQVLLDCDINKPSWKGKFDTQILDDRQKYVYTSNSAKIPIRKMIVNYEQKSGKIISIAIEKKISTILFSNEQQITYFPEKSFKINARQRAFFMKDFNSEVEIKYLCKN